MVETVISKLLEANNNFVFIGEAGSGKTEAALNIARLMAREASRPVHFFDMDQTKPLFRARDAAGTLEAAGVSLHFQTQYMDAPTVASGVIELLSDKNAVVLLDVGGGSHGSHMIGQFSRILNGPGSKALYILNPYRAWSGSREDVEQTMSRVMAMAHLKDAALVANPNLGPRTTAADVIDGVGLIREMFPERKIEFVCALSEICGKVEAAVLENVVPVRLDTLPEWLLKE